MSNEFFKNFWRRLFRRESDSSLRETLEELIEESQELEPSIASDERELLGNVLSLRDLMAEDVMTPRADIIAVPQTISGEDLLSLMIKTQRSRFPIYRETLDEAIGIVDIKDVLAWCANKKEFSIRQVLKEVLYVSPTMRTLDLLFRMRATGNKMALVVDEYGGVDGLITLSDLMGEIIGDIQDAQETSIVSKLTERPDGAIVADARVTLEEISEDLNIDMTLGKMADDIDTMGGLVISLAGRVPVRGELITHPNGIEIEILDADPRRVKRVCLYLTNFKIIPKSARG
ncbi:MAG: hemolysin family protein [Alphaproteobacteria bacterium]